MPGMEGLLDGSMDAGRRETFNTVWEGTEGPAWAGAKSKGKIHGYLAVLGGERSAVWREGSGVRTSLSLFPFGLPRMMKEGYG